MIELERVSKRVGASVVVDGLSFQIRRGEFFVVVGTSGAGKSTTLRMINQLVPHSSGSIRVEGKDVREWSLTALRRRMGYVIQSIGLFPHWTVERNVGAVPELLAWPKARIRERAAELLDALGLAPEHFLARYPHQLSIGQQQRVGIARALAADPDVLLMDEPFGALDPLTRDALQVDVARIQRGSRKTVVFVTHDMDEALRLASRIAVMHRGQVVQIGAPIELLSKPASEFVRDFLGRDELGLRLLSVATVASRMRSDESAAGESIPAAATLRQALSRMVSEGRDRLPVTDAAGRPSGAIYLADLLRR